MKVRFAKIFFLSTLILISGCKSKESTEESTEHLVTFLQKHNFGGLPLILMERRGDYFKDRWYKVTLYFGYGDNGNWDTCSEDAARLNMQIKRDSFRCVLAR
jgi:hypothetical protein